MAARVAATPLADRAPEAILGANPFVGIDPGRLLNHRPRTVHRPAREAISY
jgi:hypothetical protein